MKTSYAFLEKQDVGKILKHFSRVYVIPEVSLQLGVFFEKKGGFGLGLKTKGDKWSIEISSRDKKDKKESFYVLSYNSKSFVNFLKVIGFEKGSIGFRVINTFSKQNRYKIEITKDDFIGWSLKMETQNNKIRKSFQESLKLWNYELVSEQERRKILKKRIKKKSEANSLFNEKLNVLNQNFIQKCQILGIDCSRDAKTVFNLLENKTNDYSYFEQLYFQIIGERLISVAEIKKTYKIPEITIVICSHNSHSTICQTLLSIASQNFSKKEREGIEILVIDDFSEIGVKNSLARYKGKLKDLNINIIRTEKNIGTQEARNMGLILARNDIVLFIDSDILLPKNYVREMAIRSKILPNAVFVSFKQNIDSSDKLNRTNLILKGLESPSSIDDWRVKTILKKNKTGHIIAKSEKCLDILEDSNYFKNLGFGKLHGIYAIDSMLVGHNYILRKSKILQNKLEIDCKFNGWGLEDSWLGTMLVANGAFIIPVISTGVYHIKHPPRSGSEEQKQKDFKTNLKRYKNFLNKSFI